MTRLTPVTLRARRRVEVRNFITSCHQCSLRDHIHPHPVPFEGPLLPQFLVLGEAPGITEQRRQRPFIGQTGGLFRRLLTRAGFDLTQGMFLNTVCCCPYGAPTHESLIACRPNLDAQLELAPGVPLLAVGATALDALFPGTSGSLRRMHGSALRLPGDVAREVVVPVYHPAYLARDPTVRPMVDEALGRFFALVSGLDPEFFAPTLCHRCKRKPNVAVAWDDHRLPFCGTHRSEIRKAARAGVRRRAAINRAAQVALTLNDTPEDR